MRETADWGTEALEQTEKQVKSMWSDDLRKAYCEACAVGFARPDARARRRLDKACDEAMLVDSKVKAAAKRVKDADDEAEDARLKAEATFEEAKRRMSASMARDGAQKAIQAYSLRETAIRKAEAAARISTANGSEEDL